MPPPTAGVTHRRAWTRRSTPAQVAAYVGADNYGAGQMAAQSAPWTASDGPATTSAWSATTSTAPMAQRPRAGRHATLLRTAAGPRSSPPCRPQRGHRRTAPAAEALTMLARAPRDQRADLPSTRPPAVGAAQRCAADADRADDLWLVAFDSNIETQSMPCRPARWTRMIVQNTYGMGYFGVEKRLQAAGRAGERAWKHRRRPNHRHPHPLTRE